MKINQEFVENFNLKRIYSPKNVPFLAAIGRGSSDMDWDSFLRFGGSGLPHKSMQSTRSSDCFWIGPSCFGAIVAVRNVGGGGGTLATEFNVIAFDAMVETAHGCLLVPSADDWAFFVQRDSSECRSNVSPTLKNYRNSFVKIRISYFVLWMVFVLPISGQFQNMRTKLTVKFHARFLKFMQWKFGFTLDSRQMIVHYCLPCGRIHLWLNIKEVKSTFDWTFLTQLNDYIIGHRIIDYDRIAR